MIKMCQAMRQLASGNFDVVLPGLGRKDEIGEMAAAVEEFKLQAVAKAERDAATNEAQSKAAGSRLAIIRAILGMETCARVQTFRNTRWRLPDRLRSTRLILESSFPALWTLQSTPNLFG